MGKSGNYIKKIAISAYNIRKPIAPRQIMKRYNTKSRLLGKQLWCIDCLDKTPPVIKSAELIIPLKKGHYDLAPDGASIDKRVVGICINCLKDRNEFQKNNTEPVDVNHKHLVYKNI